LYARLGAAAGVVVVAIIAFVVGKRNKGRNPATDIKLNRNAVA